MSDLSYAIAKGFSEADMTMIVELPCLGIPRLGFASGVMDKERHTEAAIASFEQRKSPRMDMFNQQSDQFYVLPANVSPRPDYPLAEKVETKTLMDFVPALQQFARSEECAFLILDCQGQMTSPMTFFALKAAGQVVIPVDKPADTAYALACVKRLTQAYDHPADKFIIACSSKTKSVKSAVLAYSRDGDLPIRVRVAPWDSRKVTRLLYKGFESERDRESQQDSSGSGWKASETLSDISASLPVKSVSPPDKSASPPDKSASPPVKGEPLSKSGEDNGDRSFKGVLKISGLLHKRSRRPAAAAELSVNL